MNDSRARREGAELLRRPPSGPVAYAFVMGSLSEILRSFGFSVVFPEIQALQLAARHEAQPYLEAAEDYGYSPDVCGYLKTDVAVQLRGTAPKPAIAVLTTACTTYLKWGEVWERLHGIPTFALDVPENDVGYVEGQIREFITLCETVSGRRFDIDLFRAALGYSNEMTAAWAKTIALNRRRPAPFNVLTDGTMFLGVMNAWRGTPEGATYFRRLLEEMESARGNEKWRLAFTGIPCYPIFRRFNELFTGRGGTFVASTYLAFASGGAHAGFQVDLARPIESYAEGILVSLRAATDAMFHADRVLEGMIDGFGIDGVVFHAAKSCRTVSTGLADARRALRGDVPSLYLESDMMDRRAVSEVQMKSRVDAFFETLEKAP